jgi:hypothetical protein
MYDEKTQGILGVKWNKEEHLEGDIGKGCNIEDKKIRNWGG